MNIHSLGHACWLIESSFGTILTDPVFDDLFEGDTVQACPSRSIHQEQLPTIDIIYISHRHLDHFHIPTLQLLPKQIPILAPNDSLTISALQRLGFTDIRPLEPFVIQQFGQLQIHPIPSPSKSFIEYAALFVDGDVSLFNQVDTPLNEGAFDYLAQYAPNLSCHLAMFASQEFGWFAGQAPQSAEIYTQNLRAVQQVNGRLIIPAAAGFRFSDSFSYLNSFLFPIPHSRFIKDVEKLLPENSIADILPGDIIELLPEGHRIHQQQSSYCQCTKDDRHLLTYNPTAPVPAIIDDNPNGYPLEHLHGYPTMIIEKAFLAYVQAGQRDEVIDRYHRLSVDYQIEIVTPQQTLQWNLQFTPSSVTLIPSEQGFACQAKWKIAASAFIDLCEGKRSCFAVRPYSRKYSTILYAQHSHKGILGFEETLPDLLTHFLLNMRIRIHGEEEAMLKYYGLTVDSCS